MKHYGDITKISGAAVEPVDVITGGSPCQDLSVAGKRAGLSGERSGLFMEQIRIIKEMREHDIHSGRSNESVRPRYMVWENVPGAFSSNGGEDFRAVLEETARVVAKDAVVPEPPNGKWSYSGCIMGDGWSIAWRTHDAQFWGVPQRRRRIALVADFGGHTAPEILFKQGSLRGDSSESCGTKEATAAGTDGYADVASKALNPWDIQSKHIQSPEGIAESLYSGECRYGGGEAYVMHTALPLENHPNDSRMKIREDGKFQTLSSRMGTGGNNTPMVMKIYQKVTGTLDCGIVKQVGNQLANSDMYVANGSIVSRLTPLECERLQGYPDGWTDIGDWVDSRGKKHKGDADSPRYKALGNSIALPFWQWMAGRMAKYLPENATMASLFDGIGGFPLVFSRSGVKPVWASEIEKFPIAVTKIRFKEDGDEQE